MLKKLLVIALSVVALAAAGCGGGDKQAQTTIKVGATAGPHAEVVEAAAKEAAKSGLRYRLWSSLIMLHRTKLWQMASWIW